MTAHAALARELYDARAQRRAVPVPPSAREGGLDLAAAYAIEKELRRLRRADGRVTVGRKVGFANRAMWRALKLPTLIFASMYDDTVIYARGREASLSLGAMHCPRLEPEVVFMLKDPPQPGDAATVLSSVEWVALGFEVVDCPFPEWKVHPVDFLASFGLHAALVVGNPRPVRGDDIAGLIDQLAALQVTLSRNDEIVEEGFGRNALKNPAACLAELVSAIAAQPDAEPLGPAELVSSGSLTDAQPINPGERWRVEAVNMDLPGLGVRLES